MPLPSPWNESKMQQLQTLYHRGLSFALIAADIGVTRGSAIGKAHRMQLPRRIVISACKARPPRLHPAPKRRKVAMVSKPAEPVIDPDHDYRCSIYQLTDRHCRWPLWRGSTAHEHRLYCGIPTARVSAGVPYCRRHRAKMLNQASTVNA